jgi:hypothetical protein
MAAKDAGLEPEGIPRRNFAALKTVMPWIDAIDFDDEELYEVETTVPFASMLYEVGFTVTFCPYSQESFWIECLAQLEAKQPGLVSGFNLQCYAGGASNEPDPWIEAVEAKMGSGFDAKSFVRPGLWGRHGEECALGRLRLPRPRHRRWLRRTDARRVARGRSYGRKASISTRAPSSADDPSAAGAPKLARPATTTVWSGRVTTAEPTLSRPRP